jgi:hypothetical protein
MRWIVIPIIIVLLVLMGLCSRAINQSHERYLEPFQTHIDEYVSANVSVTYTEPYIQGKLIIVDVDKKCFDDIIFYIQEELRASSPTEVGTVVRLHWGKQVVGYYEYSRDKAYRVTCLVQVIDWTKKIIVGEKYFIGEDPPKMKDLHGSGVGKAPTVEIETYLAGLPQN